MKNLIFITIALLSFSARADVTVIKSNLNGELTELPNGTFQLINPTITVGKKNYCIYQGADSAKAVCQMLGKRYIAEALTSVSAETERIIQFREDNSMVLTEPVGYSTYTVANVITCK